ncbi:MAG TPA: hypothetical protein VHZ81_05675 [Galbitalea sp.]|jgi:hypothetical protein|nr:hypothetical protein [Galbitalea sp.]
MRHGIGAAVQSAPIASDSFGLLPPPLERLFRPVADVQSAVHEQLEAAQRGRGGGVLAEYVVPTDPASLIDTECCQ